MDLETLPPDPEAAGRLCPCACPFCCRPVAVASWRRSFKRRLEPELSDNGGGGEVTARVEAEDDVVALREAVASQQEAIQELCTELEEERNAAASAASETMSMILRLQHEKAEVQMEARQFKRFAEEKMEHDQVELLALEEMLFKRDEALQALTFQVQAYRQLLVSNGIDPGDEDAAAISGGGPTPAYLLGSLQFDEIPTFAYPPLRCDPPNRAEGDWYEEPADPENYAPGEKPHAKEEHESLEQRLCQLESLAGTSGLLEKGVVEERPPPSGHFRPSSSYESVSGVNLQEPLKGEEFPASMGRPLDDDSSVDGMSDRVYTIDAVHGVAEVSASEDFADAIREEMGKRGEMNGGMDGGSPDIKNLHIRLQALEADRESMRQAIISMRTEKAQLMLLREIAQKLHKDVPPEKRIIKKKSSTTSFSIVALIKWIISFIFWKKKVSRTKYSFGSSNNNVGLMLLLDNSPRISSWRSVS